MPAQPRRQRKLATDFVPFDGQLVERHTTPSGAEYVRITLGTAGGAATEVDDPSTVIDAEFLFLEGGRPPGAAQHAWLAGGRRGGLPAAGVRQWLPACLAARPFARPLAGSRGSAVCGCDALRLRRAWCAAGRRVAAGGGLHTVPCSLARHPAGDNIVNVRAASRVEPEGKLGSGGQLAISFREGLVVDK